MKTEGSFFKSFVLVLLATYFISVIRHLENGEDLITLLFILLFTLIIPVVVVLLCLWVKQGFFNWDSLPNLWKKIKNQLEPSDKVKEKLKELQAAVELKNYKEALQLIEVLTASGISLSESDCHDLKRCEYSVNLYLEKELYMANGYKNAQAYESAIELYLKVLKIDNKYDRKVRTAINLSEAYIALGQPDKIEEAINILIKARKDDRDNRRRFDKYRQIEKKLYECYSKLGDVEKVNSLRLELSKENKRSDHSSSMP